MKYSLIKLNSGRSCLKYIIKAFNIKEIHVPYYLCPVIRNIAHKENCKIRFYHIDNNFKPAKIFNEDDFILYPDYWGICSKIINKLDKSYQNLIVDNAHSFFSKPKGIASFNSLRKFFPELRDGAFLYTSKKIKINIPKDDFDYNAKILNYNEICKNEFRIDNSGIKLISEKTDFLYNQIEIEEYKQKRIENFWKLHNLYKDTNILEIDLNRDDVPFCYPLLAQDEKEASKIAAELESDGIIIYRYWNNLPKSFNESSLYKQLIPIPLL